MMIDPNLAGQFALRWFHFIFGITWIGLLYFFNFVNGNFQAKLDAATKQKVVPELMPRALWFFRWGAMLTLLTGLGILYLKFFIPSGGGFPALMATSYGHFISMGAGFGLIMWFNVWFIIWPSQKKIIAAVRAGEKPDPAKVELARKASKFNTFLSIPMLFGMGAASHLPIAMDNKQAMLGAVAVAIIVGFIVAKLLYMTAAKLDTNS